MQSASCLLLITLSLVSVSELLYISADEVQNRPESVVGQNKIQFVDVTSTSVIRFKHVDGRSGQKYLLETLGSGAAFFDYDNDGDIDLYIVNAADLPGFTSKVPPTNVLYRNNGDGTFTDVTSQADVGHPGYGVGCAAADYDNDGAQDLYVTNYGANVLYHNNGDGRLQMSQKRRVLVILTGALVARFWIMTMMAMSIYMSSIIWSLR